MVLLASLPLSSLLRPFKLSIVKNTPQHVISSIHAVLFLNRPSTIGRACLAWEQGIDIALSPEDWNHIYTHTHKGSINVTTQVNCYKIIFCCTKSTQITLNSAGNETKIMVHCYTSGGPALTYKSFGLWYPPLSHMLRLTPLIIHLKNSLSTTHFSAKEIINNSPCIW